LCFVVSTGEPVAECIYTPGVRFDEFVPSALFPCEAALY
jgi:hypothetical protein